MTKYLNLHGHSEYSSKDAISKIKDIILKHKELGLDAFVLTDHGVVSGFPEAFKLSKEYDIKFIPGCEFYLKPQKEYDLKEKNLAMTEINSILRKKTSTKEEIEYANIEKNKWDFRDCKKNYHLTVLCKNQTGLNNLFKIYSEGELYYKHRISTESLFKHSEGLIILSGCFGSELAFFIKSRQLDKAEELMLKYKNHFKDDYYIEIQYHMLNQFEKEAEKGYMKEIETYNTVIELAKKHNIKMIVSNDSHFINKEDQKLHDIYKAICYHKTEDQKTGDMGFSGSGYHIMTTEEIKEYMIKAEYDKLVNIDELIENTQEINNKISKNIDIEKPNNFIDKSKELKDLVMLGWENKRKGTKYEKESLKRIEHELNIINKKNFSNYFINMKLIVDTAYENNVLTGPGRGSGAGSEVVYLLNITKTDPIKYGLMFERFLNPDRNGMPDIDVDFESIVQGTYDLRGPDYVIEKLKHKFKFNGRISNITTASSIILFKKLAGYFNISASNQNHITTSDLGKEFLSRKETPTKEEFKNLLNNLGLLWNEQWEKVSYYLDLCYYLDGIVFGESIHASGVILTEEESNLPLDSNGVIAFNGSALESYDYIKYDLLALDTLNPIHDIYGLDINWDEEDDEEVWKIIQSADTDYVFQLGAGIPKNMMKEGKASNVSQLGEITSINRPGPLGISLNTKWIDVQNKQAKFSNEEIILYKLLKKSFGKTHSGLMIYQEDVMKISVEGAGFTLTESDHLRKAIGKKNEDLLMSFKDKFINNWKYNKLININELGKFLPDDIIETKQGNMTALEIYQKLNQGIEIEI